MITSERFKRAEAAKLLLYFLLGCGAVAVGARLLFGLGSTTALTNTVPWGLWKGFNVVASVPLAAGGFVLAGMFYIFHMKRYHPLMRATVLMALLGYTSVALSLTIDIGVPWRIWFPIIFWQHHSVLFEVAWCIILYLNVLLLEFSPVVLERLPFGRLLNLIRRSTVLLVIIGIGLSTLHQSSLGTLFLIMPFRLHPLWYGWELPVEFFISAIGLGMFAVTGLTIIVAWLYEAEPGMDVLSRLARGGAVFMGAFFLIRLSGVAFSGKLSYLAELSYDSINFYIEMLLSGLLPVLLMMSPKVRGSKAGLLSCSAMVIVGTVLHRVNCTYRATQTSVGEFYFPSAAEILFTLGMLSAAALVFLFFVEHFGLYPFIRPEENRYRFGVEPGLLLNPALSGYRFYSLMFVLGAAIAFALLPEGALQKCKPRRTPVKLPRRALAVPVALEGSKLVKFRLPENKTPGDEESELKEVLVIDGNRDGRFVLFDHHAHMDRNGGKKSCVLCHHLNMPKDRETSCWECHRDMFLPTDIFNHESHVAQMNGNSGCAKCHKDPSLPKTRQTSARCEECHEDMLVKGSLVRAPKNSADYVAVGYMSAMHELCIDCHKKKQSEQPKRLPVEITRCAWCHAEGEARDLRKEQTK